MDDVDDFEGLFSNELLAGALDQYLDPRAAFEPIPMHNQVIKVYVHWQQTMASICFPLPTSAWTYTGSSQMKQEWTLGPLRLVARHFTCTTDPDSSKGMCRPCINKATWRRRCETPTNIFILYDVAADQGVSASAALLNLQVVPATPLAAEEIQYYIACCRSDSRRSPFDRAGSAIGLRQSPSFSSPPTVSAMSPSPLPSLPPLSSTPSTSPVLFAPQALSIERAMLLCLRYQTDGIFATPVISVLCASTATPITQCCVVADPLSTGVVAPFVRSGLLVLMVYDSMRMLSWAQISQHNISAGGVLRMAYHVPTNRSAFAIASDPLGFTTEDVDSQDTLVLSEDLPLLAPGELAIIVLSSDGLCVSDVRSALPYVILMQM